MKKLITVLTLGVILASCSNNKKSENDAEEKDTAAVVLKENDPVKAATQDSIDWANVPELKDIGSFPFIKAKEGFRIVDENNGASELFSYEKMENYLGGSVYTTEGKLAALVFEGKDRDFNQREFDAGIYAYLDKTGAKQLYKGNYPANETVNEPVRLKLKENLWTGKNRTLRIRQL
ncbi:hypothetical protein [Pedobacter frigidisoli]|uniref:hypothetical protein n=1 Tax=Pedobacter frigidisoli TaxID=2530455 RepID=UPI00292D99EB|nr:hypothetical protein [Pedobacter frigidisoli]